MKLIIKKILSFLGYSIQKIQDRSESLDSKEIIAHGRKLVQQFSPNLQILHGPFLGMKYPSLEITELALAPKFFGTYESQLHTQLFKLFETGYDDILDVGCAEGYYAVGFAMKSKDSTVHCFDINIADLEFCSKMAQLNGVSNITYNSFCSPNTLINFQHRGRTLIFCDCEGYEIDLFTEEVVATLKTTDVLIEFHDLHNNAISKTLLDRFKKTHDVAVINNEDQFSRINICAQIDKMSPKDRVFVKTEHRGGEYQMRYMEWGFFQAKSL